jgi:hypothetical protein
VNVALGMCNKFPQVWATGITPGEPMFGPSSGGTNCKDGDNSKPSTGTSDAPVANSKI